MDRFRLSLKCLFFMVFILTVSVNVNASDPKLFKPFEKSTKFTPVNEIDRLVLAALNKKGIKPANLCSDEVFIRRVYLDLIGTLPQVWEVKGFLKDKRSNKRAILIERLFRRKEFADYWSLKWCDILRVKAEYPIRLWPNGVQAYHRWIHDAIRKNKPYDKFARELLTSSGSNFRVPPVNFYRAVQGRDPAALSSAVALAFMGERFEKWPEERQKNMNVFFSGVAYKGTAEWKEEIIYLNPLAEFPEKAVLPDGSLVAVKPGDDPRILFAAWLISPENPSFSRNMVNRIWSWLLGRGLIDETDDIRPDNPASNPELLRFLEKEFVKSGYDLRHIYRLILNSRTYQQSSIPQTNSPDAEELLAYYPVRQLDAEVLIDALCLITGPRENYSSPIPEPFTFIPQENRSINLADGSITSSFLEMFGRPSRDTGLESERRNNPTSSQRLHMLNSTHIQNKIERSWRLKQLLRSTKKNRKAMVDNVYLAILSRYPTKEELEEVKKYFQTKGIKQKQAATDLVWALINSKEFLFRH